MIFKWLMIKTNKCARYKNSYNTIEKYCGKKSKLKYVGYQRLYGTIGCYGSEKGKEGEMRVIYPSEGDQVVKGKIRGYSKDVHHVGGKPGTRKCVRKSRSMGCNKVGIGLQNV